MRCVCTSHHLENHHVSHHTNRSRDPVLESGETLRRRDEAASLVAVIEGKGMTDQGEEDGVGPEIEKPIVSY
jgi:hypothetical protein